MKRISSVFFAFVLMAICLTACGDTKEEDRTVASEPVISSVVSASSVENSDDTSVDDSYTNDSEIDGPEAGDSEINDSDVSDSDESVFDFDDPFYNEYDIEAYYFDLTGLPCYKGTGLFKDSLVFIDEWNVFLVNKDKGFQWAAGGRDASKTVMIDGKEYIFYGISSYTEYQAGYLFIDNDAMTIDARQITE